MENKQRYAKWPGERKRTCIICGKEFSSLPGYTYKKRISGDKYKWYCSYGCYRKDNN